MIKFYYDVVLGLVFWNFEQPNVPNYSLDKENWVTFNNGKEKMKLRKYIDKKAEIIGSVSLANKLTIRTIYIEAYNLEGLSGLERVHTHTVQKILKSINN